MNDVIDFETIDEHGPQSYHGTFAVEAADLDRDEVANGGKVTIDANAKSGDADQEYVVDGTVSFTADLECSRCVEPYPFANTSTFHVRFRPRPETSTENEEVEITDREELDVEFYSEREIPLRDFALEQVQLSIPMKPLCNESCLGLCPQCGANRTREKCTCEESIVDDRWGALKNIRDELSKKNNV
ncbi:MAG: YceD family protein [Thermoanaerobaculia bacterium]